MYSTCRSTQQFVVWVCRSTHHFQEESTWRVSEHNILSPEHTVQPTNSLAGDSAQHFGYWTCWSTQHSTRKSSFLYIYCPCGSKQHLVFTGFEGQQNIFCTGHVTQHNMQYTVLGHAAKHNMQYTVKGHAAKHTILCLCMKSNMGFGFLGLYDTRGNR